MTHVYSMVLYNESELPIMVEGLVQVGIEPGLNQIKSVLVMFKEKKTVYSITGNWSITTFFDEPEHEELWKKFCKKTYNLYEIGEFRARPCFLGTYSSMSTDLFKLTYNVDKQEFTFSYC